MSTTLSLSCNHCGAPLSALADTKYLTCAHCGAKLQVHHSGSAHYTSVLERIDARTEQMSQNLEAIRLQNELERIDREWAMEREKFLTRDKNGNTSEPGSGGSVAGFVFAAVVGVFAIFFAGFASNMGAPTPIVLAPFGMLALVVFGLISGMNSSAQFSAAKKKYEDRRTAVLRELEQRK